MPKRILDLTTPYQSIRGASRISGLAQGYIRAGCKNGTIPCLRVGREYKDNMPLFLQQLEAASTVNLKGVHT